MSCKLEEAIKDIEALASKPGAKSIAKELAQIANEAKESLKIQPATDVSEIKMLNEMLSEAEADAVIQEESDTMSVKDIKNLAKKVAEECK